jgi:hypothetical protein
MCYLNIFNMSGVSEHTIFNDLDLFDLLEFSHPANNEIPWDELASHPEQFYDTTTFPFSINNPANLTDVEIFSFASKLMAASMGSCESPFKFPNSKPSPPKSQASKAAVSAFGSVKGAAPSLQSPRHKSATLGDFIDVPSHGRSNSPSPPSQGDGTSLAIAQILSYNSPAGSQSDVPPPSHNATVMANPTSVSSPPRVAQPPSGNLINRTPLTLGAASRSSMPSKANVNPPLVLSTPVDLVSDAIPTREASSASAHAAIIEDKRAEPTQRACLRKRSHGVESSTTGISKSTAEIKERTIITEFLSSRKRALDVTFQDGRRVKLEKSR